MPKHPTAALAAALAAVAATGLVASPAVGATSTPAAAAVSLTVLPAAPGATGSDGQFIDASGRVAGDASYPADPATYPEGLRRAATQWTGRSVTSLNGPLTASDVRAQSTRGLVVGQGTAPGSAAPSAYLFQGSRPTRLTVPGVSNATSTEAVAVNASGQVVVDAATGASAIWRAGRATPVSAGTATTINDLGQYAGARTNPTGGTTAFVVEGGTTTYLSSPGWTSSSAASINSRGQVLGSVSRLVGTDPDTSYVLTHAALWDHGTFTDLAPADDPTASTSPVALNDRGQAVGTVLGSGGASGGFLWDGGTFTTLPNLGGASAPAAINNAGQVVINGATTAGDQPYVWRSGAATALPLTTGTSRAVLADAFSINDRGQISGTAAYDDPANPRRAVVWTVKP